MMIGDDQQQQDDQVEHAMVLGENFTPPPLVNVDVSEDLLATHITETRKPCSGCQWEFRIVLSGHSLILMQVAT